MCCSCFFFPSFFSDALFPRVRMLYRNKRVLQNRFVFVRRRTREDAYQTILHHISFPQSINVRFYCHLPSYQLSKQANENTLSSYDAAHAKIVSNGERHCYPSSLTLTSPPSLSLYSLNSKTLKHSEKNDGPKMRRLDSRTSSR